MSWHGLPFHALLPGAVQEMGEGMIGSIIGDSRGTSQYGSMPAVPSKCQVENVWFNGTPNFGKL